MRRFTRNSLALMIFISPLTGITQTLDEQQRNSIIYFSPPGLSVNSTPTQDLQAVRDFYVKRFPQLKFDDYIFGALNFSPDARAQYNDLMENPPFYLDLEQGKALWEKPFKNGKNLAGCFPNGGKNVVGNYPQFDDIRKKVVTFEVAINDCLRSNGEAEFSHSDMNTMGKVTAYARTLSDGMRVNILVKGSDAEKAYQAGKRYFYTRRGQLNMACVHCHFPNAGNTLRTELLSPAVGHTTHWPVFRQGTDLWTLHRRYSFCDQQVRHVPQNMGSEDYNNLEYFHSYLSNGLPLKSAVFRK